VVVPQAHPEKPNYIAVNADEGEPGTFKDRTLMELDPHRCVEGFIIAAYALDVHTVYCYVRGELVLVHQAPGAGRPRGARQGLPGRQASSTRTSSSTSSCTPARARTSAARRPRCSTRSKGLRGEPRLKPPFPAVVGAFGAPTIVNNLETLATVPTIIDMGGDAFSKLSRLHHLRDGGVRLYGVSGHVKRPGVYEAPVGITLRELIYDLGGGVRGGRKIKAVIPGGSSTPVLREDLVHAPDEKHILHPWHGKSHLDVPMGVDTMRGLGTCSAPAAPSSWTTPPPWCAPQRT
jgi:NADH-quinone oxidoreductase subunit F